MARILLPLTAFLLLLPCSIAGAEDGFRLRSLNPLLDDPATEPAPPQAQVIGVPSYRQPVPPEEPSLLDRIGDGTRKTFQRVGDAVRSPFQSRDEPRVATRESWFQMPWSRQQSQQGPQNVGEFMDMDRPQY